mmetsp:Transcript_58575/g.154777  ORF Transcript_58575/g.154777 Transcript_58575/m.154777 type:complete len:80 (+) Transcript_58575:1403-1642(+)
MTQVACIGRGWKSVLTNSFSHSFKNSGTSPDMESVETSDASTISTRFDFRVFKMRGRYIGAKMPAILVSSSDAQFREED